MARNDRIEEAREYHRRSSHSEASLRASPHSLDFSNQPIPFKVYTTLDPIPLPRDLTSPGMPTLAALAAEPSDERAGTAITLPVLARLLYVSAGVLRKRPYPGGEIFFRAYPNTGALYHVDLYVVCGDMEGLAAGVYHFSPHDFALRRLRDGDFRETLVHASGHEPHVADAPALLVSASTYWRNAWKYRERTYRHCFWDAGTMHANLLAVAHAAGVQTRIALGFTDENVERLLGLDPQREGALCIVTLGTGAPPPPPAPAMPPLRLETLPLSRSEIAYPAVRAMHAASSLDDPDHVARWRTAALSDRTPPATGRLTPLQPLENGERPAEPLERVIARRGSTRAFAPELGVSYAALSSILRECVRPMPLDCLSGEHTLSDVYIIAHNVRGLEPGAYFYRREDHALELLRSGHFRTEAGRLGLFQTLPADAAVNIYCLTDLERVLRAFGNRGYRAAQLEGGLLGGRFYLAAYALRLGATGLTFLDDEVTEFFSPHAAGKSVMFLTAIGRSVRQRETARPA